MKLSTRSIYSIRALMELALASGRDPLSAALIATRQELSVAYLEQLLHRLKRRGLVRSVRGPRGGYVLAKAPQHITMAEVVQVLDGVNGIGYAVANGTGVPARHGRGTRNGHHVRDGVSRLVRVRPTAPSDTQRHVQRVVHAVSRCVYERLMQSLDAVTLQDLCDEVRTAAGEPLEHRYVFHI